MEKNGNNPDQLSFEEQRQLFERRGIVFPEDTHTRDALKIKEIGYYKLKEFSYYFAKRDDRGALIFEDGEIIYKSVKFKDLILRYYQDKNLRIFLLHAIEDIEVNLNNIVATRLGQKYGAYGYLDFKNWCERSNNRFETEEKQFYFKKGLLRDIKRSNLPDIFDKRNLNSEGFPSVWTMTDCLTFGSTLHLMGIMSKNNKKIIAGNYGCNPSELLSWFKCLNFIRNVCAHNSDLIDVKINTKPLPPAKYKECLHKVPGGYTNRIAIVIYIVKYLMTFINPKYKFGNIMDSLLKISVDDKTANDLGFVDRNAIKKLNEKFEKNDN